VLEHQPCALDVRAERLVELREIGSQPRKMEHVREVGGQRAQVATCDIHGAHGDPGRFESFARRERARRRRRRDGRVRLARARPGAGEARDPPHLVVRREMVGEGGPDRAAHAGDEDLLVGDHRNRRE
jgi:hypothetical protein